MKSKIIGFTGLILIVGVIIFLLFKSIYAMKQPPKDNSHWHISNPYIPNE